MAQATPTLLSSVVKDFDGLTGKQLILWERPRATAAVVAALVTVVLIFGVMQYTILTFLCRLAQLAIVAYGGLVYLQKSAMPRKAITDQAKALVDRMVPYLIRLADFAALVVSWEDPTLSRNVLIATLVGGVLGNMFSDLTVLAIVGATVFAGPVGYLRNKDQIDPMLKQFAGKLSQALAAPAEGQEPHSVKRD